MKELVFAAVEGTAYFLDGPAMIQRMKGEDPVLSKVITSLKENTELPPPVAS